LHPSLTASTLRLARTALCRALPHSFVDNPTAVDKDWPTHGGRRAPTRKRVRWPVTHLACIPHSPRAPSASHIPPIALPWPTIRSSTDAHVDALPGRKQPSARSPGRCAARAGAGHAPENHCGRCVDAGASSGSHSCSLGCLLNHRSDSIHSDSSWVSCSHTVYEMSARREASGPLRVTHRSFAPSPGNCFALACVSCVVTDTLCSVSLSVLNPVC